MSRQQQQINKTTTINMEKTEVKTQTTSNNIQCNAGKYENNIN